MSEPEFDAEGYPTKATLRAVREWPIQTWADTEALLRFVGAAWSYPNYFVRLGRRKRPYRGATLERRWLVSTGGWSGNEDLIAAMQSNVMFWMLSWMRSERGGHYEFRSR